MARSYGRVLSTIWADNDWTALTRGAQHTYMLLLSQPKLTLVGLLDYLPSRWARLTADSDLASVEADIQELETSRFVLVDRHTDELLIRTFIRHDLRTIQANANLIKGMWGAWATIQSDRLRRAVVETMPEDLWTTSRCQPHPEALQIRRSPRLEPMVPTDGSDHQSQPPSSFLPSPSSFLRVKGGGSLQAAEPDSPPSRRCKQHTGDEHPPPCGACADARRTHDTWKRQQVTATGPAIPLPPPVTEVLGRYQDIPVETDGKGIAAAKAALRGGAPT